MKKDIHPAYHPVIFVDHGANWEFTTRSTMKTKEVRKVDGVDHYVIRLDVSSASHPFYTGKQRFVDAAGRIDKFRSKYGTAYTKKATLERASAEKAGAAAAGTPPAGADTKSSG